MTGTSIAEGAREDVLIDTDSTARRWSDAETLRHINRALRDIWKAKPDAFWTEDTGEVTSCPQIEALADEIALEDNYENALIYFTVSWMLGKDTMDKSIIERALYFKKLGLSELLT